jgi:hypothetical protein
MMARSLGIAATILLGSLTLFASAPRVWYLAGNKPMDYETGVDAQASHEGHPSAYFKAKKRAIDGFGTLMLDFRGTRYVGKRVRFSAFVKSEGVKSWEGLWMRMDKDKGVPPLAFDNIQDRPITGTADWKNYAEVLDVPDGATGIFFGMMIHGTGNVWMSDVKVETVGTDVPTTAMTMGAAGRPDGPTNLNFEQVMRRLSG